MTKSILYWKNNYLDDENYWSFTALIKELSKIRGELGAEGYFSMKRCRNQYYGLIEAIKSRGYWL